MTPEAKRGIRLRENPVKVLEFRPLALRVRAETDRKQRLLGVWERFLLRMEKREKGLSFKGLDLNLLEGASLPSATPVLGKRGQIPEGVALGEDDLVMVLETIQDFRHMIFWGMNLMIPWFVCRFEEVGERAKQLPKGFLSRETLRNYFFSGQNLAEISARKAQLKSLINIVR